VVLICLFISLANADVQWCGLCKLIVGVAEIDLANDKKLENTIGKQLLSGCNSLKDAKAKKTCEALFSDDNFPLFVNNLSKKVGLTAEEICEGIKAC